MQTYEVIYKKLLHYYGPQGWWPAESIFEIMVGAILVQRTNWNNVVKAIQNLSPVLTPEKLASMPTEKVAIAIRSSGFYNQKAKRLKAFLHWYKNYDYHHEKLQYKETEHLRAELLGIYGIGEETANVMLLYAFNRPVFVADAYARRIFKRFGLDMPTSDQSFRLEVESNFPTNLQAYQEFHALIVEHAKVYCKVKPLCRNCPLFNNCKRVGV
ncbi:endonuclease III domain-containing protein [Virgibacillus proomii]|jgi:endonuclease III related protein|uniref:endonuclease III domain-containing protein n=1 Tax=Virgibacillus proomii TaxID=84407 RepID=UPI00098515AD|nr:endonuclease III domain-containing protein [Virgibacillus proomii]